MAAGSDVAAPVVHSGHHWQSPPRAYGPRVERAHLATGICVANPRLSNGFVSSSEDSPDSRCSGGGGSCAHTRERGGGSERSGADWAGVALHSSRAPDAGTAATRRSRHSSLLAICSPRRPPPAAWRSAHDQCYCWQCSRPSAVMRRLLGWALQTTAARPCPPPAPYSLAGRKPSATSRLSPNQRAWAVSPLSERRITRIC